MMLCCDGLESEGKRACFEQDQMLKAEGQKVEGWKRLEKAGKVEEDRSFVF